MGGIVNKRRRSVYPVLLQRQQIADSFSRCLDKLGLERLPKPVPSLATYMEAKRHSDESRELILQFKIVLAISLTRWLTG